jgi:prolipoprotein diacylglyceryltransferase
MHPILFQVGGINIYSYGVLVASGVLAGLWYSRK